MALIGLAPVVRIFTSVECWQNENEQRLLSSIQRCGLNLRSQLSTFWVEQLKLEIFAWLRKATAGCRIRLQLGNTHTQTDKSCHKKKRLFISRTDHKWHNWQRDRMERISWVWAQAAVHQLPTCSSEYAKGREKKGAKTSQLCKKIFETNSNTWASPAEALFVQKGQLLGRKSWEPSSNTCHVVPSLLIDYVSPLLIGQPLTKVQDNRLICLHMKAPSHHHQTSEFFICIWKTLHLLDWIKPRMSPRLEISWNKHLRHINPSSRRQSTPKANVIGQWWRCKQLFAGRSIAEAIVDARKHIPLPFSSDDAQVAKLRKRIVKGH